MAPSAAGWSGPRDALWIIISLFRAAKLGMAGLRWFALFDWKAPGAAGYMACGLFPKDATISTARPAAWAIKALCAVTGDTGVNKRTFAPGKLAVTVTGLPAGADWDVYQSSDGRFFVPIWLSAVNPGGASTPVSVTFGSKPALVTEYDVGSGASWTGTLPPAVQSVPSPSSVTVQLNAAARVLVVVP
jgi:hypothetical protein